MRSAGYGHWRLYPFLFVELHDTTELDSGQKGDISLPGRQVVDLKLIQMGMTASAR